MSILQLGRLNRILEIDPENNTATVEAGCILQALREQAAAVGRPFPLSLGAEGSCQIGGNIATNAGGVQGTRLAVVYVRFSRSNADATGDRTHIQVPLSSRRHSQDPP